MYCTQKKLNQNGFTLLELALTILTLALALAPVVQLIGGSSSANGNATQVNALKSKEAIVANTMVDKVLARDFSEFNCDVNGNAVAFNPDTDLPAGTSLANSLQQYNLCRVQGVNSELYYQWTVIGLNEFTNSNDMPSKNQYYEATLKVMGPDRNPNNPLFTIPTNFYYNEGSFSIAQASTGVMLAIDTSNSMAGSSTAFPFNVPFTKQRVPGGSELFTTNGIRQFLAPPYFFYRYNVNLFSGNDWGAGNFSPADVPSTAILDAADDAQLDMIFAKAIAPDNGFNDLDITTPYNEKFPYSTASNSLLGSGNCASTANTDWTSNDSSNLLRYLVVPYARTNVQYREMVQKLCELKPSQQGWVDVNEQFLSRLEAARTAILTLILKMEEVPQVAQNVSIGFIPWSVEAELRHRVVPANPTFANGSLNYETLRNKVLWLNRADPSSQSSLNPILMSNRTNMRDGLEKSVAELAPYDRKIIILLTDGLPFPNAGVNSTTALIDYSLNTIGRNAPAEDQVSLFTVKLIGGDDTFLNTMASNTPDGRYFPVNTISDLTEVFESIAFEIQKLSLLSSTDRYGLTLE
ncbi:MAG: hypothetical protein AAGI66_08475 [Cyanobacteria bacterium P01_H01_bin.74]